MAADEWRMCVDWLVRCNILPADHRATNSDAQAFDLAQALRDGVLICHLLNSLLPESVDAKDFSPRPQLSQFLCLKNIRAFLVTCKRKFGLRDADLFDPLDLFDVKDFRKVLTTLSKLSKTELSQKKFRCFPSDNRQLPEHDYYNALEDLATGFPPTSNTRPPTSHFEDDDDIYGNLQNLALENDLDDNEELYDSVYQDDDDEIYQVLCSDKQRRPSPSSTQALGLPPPTTKRDYCVKELLDTEKNYVDALRMMVTKFIKPLRNVITQQDREAIFSNIEKLFEVHSGFHSELHVACIKGNQKISEVFIEWKPKLLLYGEYCSNLPRAQDRIDELLKKGSDVIKAKIEECERTANEGKFKMRDVLHVPMQRVLKYHLLLRELVKSTEKTDMDRRGLELALEAMQDLSLYVNEVKRDNEAVQVIHEIQESIVELVMPPNTSLCDYGRLQKDGELKVRSHIDARIRSRYIFLFDKVMLMCKSRGETYSYKDAIVLGEYKMDDHSTVKDQHRKRENWNSSFLMVAKTNKMAFTFFAKTEDMRQKWLEAITLALDNTQPGSNYVMQTFTEPKECDVCGKLLRGVFFQGYYNAETKKSVHKECIGKPTVPPVPPRVNAEAAPIRMRAVCNYNGSPSPGAGRPVLMFEASDKIEILDSSDSQWWKGALFGDEGWFPAHLVEKFLDNRAQFSRKPSYLDTRPGKHNPQNGHDSHPRSHPTKPKSYQNDEIHMHEELNSKEWYVWPMDRETAVRRLNPLPNQTFLIRVSENPGRRGELSLSLKYAEAVRHIRVEKNDEGSYYLADTRFFHSLPELVEFYEDNSLADSFKEVDTTLSIPFKKLQSTGNAASRVLGYAVAVYDYAATATTQLSLKRNDRVAITSRAGNDKGWWKGEHCTTGKVGYFPFGYVREEGDE
ncbi:hypothetical protein ScPMuIL_011086 [Solemya velum]